MKRSKLFAFTIITGALVATPLWAFQPGQGSGGDTQQPGAGRGRGGDGGDRQDRPRRGGGGGGGGFGAFGGMGRDPFEPGINSGEIRDWSTRLKLSDEQKQTVEALFEAYQTQFAAEAKVARDKVESMREEARQAQDPSIWQDIMAERQSFQTKRDAMEKSFFSDVKAVLNDQQSTEWPRIERDRRREQTLGQGLIAGERVDVVQLVSDLKLSPEERGAIDPLLEQYKDELDRELVARNDFYTQFQPKMREFMRAAMGGGEAADEAELDKLIVKGREAGIRVREVNRRFARQVEALIPEASRPAFSQKVKQESYPMVYRPTHGTRVIEAAEKIEGLNDSQKSALAGFKDNYSRDLGALQTRMEKATDDQQASFSMAQMRQRGPFGMQDGPMADLDKERRTLDDALAEKVKGLLTPDQAAKLPERRGQSGQGPGDGQDRPRRRRGGNGGPGGGDQGGNDANTSS